MILRSLLFLLVICIVCLVIILLRSPRGRERWHVILPLIGILCWQGSYSIPYIVIPHFEFPRWASMLVFAGCYTLGGMLLMFYAYFPSPSKIRGITACFMALLGGAWILSCALSLSTTMTRASLLDILIQSVGWIPPAYCWLILCCFLVIVSLCYQSIHYRGQQRIYVRYGLIGLFLLCTGSLLQLFLSLGKTAIPNPLVSLVAFTGGLLILTYASTAQYPLLEIRILLRPVIAFSLAQLFLLLFRAVTEKILYELFLDIFRLPFTETYLLIITTDAIVFLISYMVVNAVVDRFLMRPPYDDRLVIRKTTANLLSITNADDIVTCVTTTLAHTIRPTACAFYLLDEQGQLKRQGNLIDDNPLPDSLLRSHPVWGLLEQQRQVVLTENLLRQTAETAFVGQALFEAGIIVAVPLIIEQELHGCLLCTEKQSGDAYTAQDLHLLVTLGHDTSLALAHAQQTMRLATLNAELEDRVEQRTLELRVVNGKLEEANAAKDYFLALVSHELVNPLTSIMGWTEIGLRSDDLTMHTRVFNTVRENGFRLKRLVYDLLDTSRMIHGKLAVEFEHTDLWYLASTTVKSLEQEYLMKKLTVVLQPPDEPMPISGDPTRLQQVIGNIFANAIKFTPTGGILTLRGERTESECILSIQDTGKGIPQERLSRIFEVFQQVPGDERSGGLGLGLALVRGIVELHNGRVTAESLGSGKGSTFTISLPLSRISTPVTDKRDLPVTVS